MQTQTSTEVLCRFSFPTSSGSVINTIGKVLDANTIECPIKKHLEVDSAIQLDVSFNKVEFYRVSDSINFKQDVRTFPSIQKFDLFGETKIYSDVLSLQGIPDACPVVTQEIGQEFHLQTPALWNRDIFL